MKTENQILDYLMHDNSLTTLECQRQFHTSELRTYISRIIKRGFNVVSVWVKDTVDGKKVKYKRYKIAKVF